MELQTTGTGSATAPTRTTTQYVLDHEGVYRSAAANVPAWEGGRKVENLLRYSENSASSSWSASSLTKTQEGDALVITSTGAYWTLNQYGFQFQDVRTRSFITSVDVKVINANAGTITLRYPDATATELNITGYSSWTRVTVSGLGSVNGAYFAFTGTKSGQVLHIRYPHLEESTGRTDTTTPSEYVPNDTAVPGAAELLDAGSVAADWVPYDTNTVTDDAGAVKITYVDNVSGASLGFSAAAALTSNLIVGKKYLVSGQLKNTGYTSVGILGIGSFFGISSSIFVPFSFTFTATTPTGNSFYTPGMGAGEITWVKNLSLKEATAGVEWFSNANGNTVASNVVTEAIGALLSPLPTLKVDPGLTNSLFHSSDLTGWSATGTPVIAYDAVGLTGTPNTATTLTDDDGSAIEFTRRSITTTANEIVTTRYFIKKDTDQTRFVGLLTGAYGANNKIYHLNTQTGDIVLGTTVGTVNDVATFVESRGAWWAVYLQCSLAGTSFNGMVIPAYGTVFGTSSAAATGSCIVGNVGIYRSKTIEQVKGTGPIFATTAAVTTGAQTGPVFDSANISATSGLITFWAQTAGANNFLATFAGHNGTSASLTDGTTTETTVGAVDVVPNGTFETNTTGWAVSRGAIAKSADYAHTGTYSAKFTNDANIGSHYAYSDNILTVGTLYEVSGWVYLPSGQTTTELRLGQAGTVFAGDPSSLKTTLTDQWVYLRAIVPAAYLSVSINTNVNDAPGDIFYFDDVSVKAVDADGPVDVLNGIGVWWHGSEMGLCVNGVCNSPVAYDGSIMSGALDIIRTAAYSAGIRTIKGYQLGNVTTYQAQAVTDTTSPLRMMLNSDIMFLNSDQMTF